MLLAAGAGTRLGELTRDTPKPLLDVAGAPIAAHTLRLVERHGYRRVFMNVHHHTGQIREALGNGERYGVSIDYLEEEALTGTAGPLVTLAAELAAVESVLVIYGDLVLDVDLGALRQAHREASADVTLMIHERQRSNSMIVVDDARRVVRFLERPTEDERRGIESSWVNSGVQLLGRAALDRLPTTVPCDLPRDLYIPHLEKLHILGHPLDGFRVAVDSPERLQLARETFAPT